VLRAKSFTINNVADVAGFLDPSINLAFLTDVRCFQWNGQVCSSMFRMAPSIPLELAKPTEGKIFSGQYVLKIKSHILDFDGSKQS
jgi:hypothetical protein